jgi:hypothetical protein
MTPVGEAKPTDPCHTEGSKAVDIIPDPADKRLGELMGAARHLEDLEVFAGQRSRMHPEPGWDMVLEALRRELDLVVLELRQLGVTKKFGR